MIYYGYFRNTNTEKNPEGQLYLVYITSSFNSGDNEEVKELLFADNPFTVEYESGDYIYKPYKCSTATIRLLNTEFDPNLNAVSALDVSVRLYRVLDNNNNMELEWAGYTIPNAYSQGYNSSYDSYELECQDCLSTLKYQDCNILRETGLFTVEDYLKKMLAQLDFIEYIYVTDNIRVPLICTNPRDSSENVNKSSIVSNILLDSVFKNDIAEDDEYRKSLDILGDICNILNITAIQKGNSLYFISYDAVANEYSSYTRYDANFNSVKVTLNSKYELVMEDSAANDTSITLDNVYGEYSLKTNSDYIEYTFPDLADWTTRVMNTCDQLNFTDYAGVYNPLLQYDSFPEVHNMHDPVELERGAVLKYWKKFEGVVLQPKLLSVFTYNIFGINPNIYNDRSIIQVNGFCYNSSGFKINNYNFGHMRALDPSQQAGIYNGKDNVVAAPIGVSKWNGNSDDLVAEGGLGVVAGEKLDYGYKLFHYADVSNFDSSLWRNATDKAAYKERALHAGYNWNLRMLEFKIPDVVLASNDYIIYNMDVEFDLDIFSNLVEGSGNAYIEKDMSFIWAEISFTDYEGNTKFYVDGQWVDSVSYPVTKLWLDVTYFPDGDDNRSKTTHAYWNKIGLKNTVKDRYGLGEDVKGFCFPSPVKQGATKGEFKITICKPWGANSTFITPATTITSPSIVIKAGKSAVRDNEELTYKYKSAVNSEKLDIDVNISSYTGSACNKNNLYCLDIDVNLTPYSKTVEYLQNMSTGDVMKPEELLLAAYRRQYSTKTVILDTSIHNDNVSMLSKVNYHRFPDKKFIVDGMAINYGYDIKTLRLVEKK